MKIPGEYNFSSTIFIKGMPPYRDMIDKLLSLPYVSSVGYTDKLIAISLRLSWKAVSVLGDIVEALSGNMKLNPTSSILKLRELILSRISKGTPSIKPNG